MCILNMTGSFLYATSVLPNQENIHKLYNFVCLIYLNKGIVPTLWDAISDIKTKKLRNSLGFNTSVFIVYVSNG